ncbi:MAG: radical SAM protein [Candidatus Portnoybacteria bacterium]|nr:radical SAM protein [Candidatus Portnoybacteria bacterium]
MKENKYRDIYYTVGKSPFIYAGYNCNNRCIFCFEADREFPHKTTDEIKKEVNIIRKNFDFINFMGQEPTLRKDIIELIAYAKNLGFREVGITTNGRMFAYKDFTKNILKNGLTQIGLTVAGSTPQMHDWHTLIKGSFEQALTGIKNILLYKKPDFSFLINLMVTQKNFKDLLKMVDFYADLDIREINIGHIMPLNKIIVHSKKIVAQMSQVAPWLIKCQDKYGQQIKFLFVEYPACVFPKPYQELAFPCLEENPQKKRIKLCQKCQYRERCTGISQAYLNLYGTQEFKL